MGTDVAEERWVRHGVPNVENPTIKRASRIVFEGEGRGVRCKETDRIEVIRVNGDWLWTETSKNGSGGDSICFTMEYTSGAVVWEGSCESVIECEYGKGRGSLGCG